MQEIMTLAHQFLQNFCAGNQQNQTLLHKHINLFLNPGVRAITNKHIFICAFQLFFTQFSVPLFLLLFLDTGGSDHAAYLHE